MCINLINNLAFMFRCTGNIAFSVYFPTLLASEFLESAVNCRRIPTILFHVMFGVIAIGSITRLGSLDCRVEEPVVGLGVLVPCKEASIALQPHPVWHSL